MKKLMFLFLLGVGAGFVLGSRAGRAPCEQLDAKIRRVAGRPDVRNAALQARAAAQQTAQQIVGKVSDSPSAVKGGSSTLIS